MHVCVPCVSPYWQSCRSQDVTDESHSWTFSFCPSHMDNLQQQQHEENRSTIFINSTVATHLWFDILSPKSLFQIRKAESERESIGVGGNEGTYWITWKWIPQVQEKPVHALKIKACIWVSTCTLWHTFSFIILQWIQKLQQLRNPNSITTAVVVVLRSFLHHVTFHFHIMNQSPQFSSSDMMRQ